MYMQIHINNTAPIEQNTGIIQSMLVALVYCKSYGALVRLKMVPLSTKDLHATGLGVREDPHTNGVCQNEESNMKCKL